MFSDIHDRFNVLSIISAPWFNALQNCSKCGALTWDFHKLLPISL